MYGLRTEVVTNIGNFYSLSDVAKEMEFNNIKEVEIIEYHVFGCPVVFDKLGRYTCEQILSCLE